MVFIKSRMFAILLYKNFLVRKRHWKLGLFVEILLTILIFASVWGMKTATFNSHGAHLPSNKNDTIYLEKDLNDYYDADDLYHLLVVPDNQFTQDFAAQLKNCYPGKICKLAKFIQMQALPTNSMYFCISNVSD